MDYIDLCFDVAEQEKHGDLAMWLDSHQGCWELQFRNIQRAPHWLSHLGSEAPSDMFSSGALYNLYIHLFAHAFYANYYALGERLGLG